MQPDDILETYQTVATEFARARDKTLFERQWLDRFLAHCPGRRILDLGCGSGLPIAGYLRDRRARLTGVDGASEMVCLFAANIPEAHAIHADMRGLDLDAQFDGILAWNSFFHLDGRAQRAMFDTFRRHAAPEGVIMFTAGPEAGTPIGSVAGKPVFHESLDPDDYRREMARTGFEPLFFSPNDAECNGHTIWMARLKRGVDGA